MARMERQNQPVNEDLIVEPDVASVLECVFGLGTHHARIYATLLDLPGSTVEEMASELDRDRSNVSRSLSTLHEKGLIERHRRLLDGGGYVYQYLPVPLGDAKRMMRAGLVEWSDRVDAIILSIEHELPV